MFEVVFPVVQSSFVCNMQFLKTWVSLLTSLNTFKTALLTAYFGLPQVKTVMDVSSVEEMPCNTKWMLETTEEKNPTSANTVQRSLA